MITGLVRRPHYEEVLAAAIKDKESKHGILSVPMQRFATDAINNPLFQRVQATLESSLQEQEKKVIEAKVFDQNLTKAAMDANVPKMDYKWATENLFPPAPPAPQPPPSSSDAKIDYNRISAEMDAVMQRRATETSHQALAAELARELAKQSVATPAQQIIREHHHHFITQPVPIRPTPGPGITGGAKRVGNSVHQQFLEEKASSSTDIPIKYFRRDGPNTTIPTISSDEFPDVMMRPQITQKGQVKQLVDKVDRPPSPGPTRPPVAVKPKIVKASKKVESPSLRDSATKKMRAILERATQQTTQQSFAKRVEVQRKTKRAGVLGKRDEPEPDQPRSIVRAPPPATSAKRRMLYPSRTEVFNMDTEPIRVY